MFEVEIVEFFTQFFKNMRSKMNQNRTNSGVFKKGTQIVIIMSNLVYNQMNNSTHYLELF